MASATGLPPSISIPRTTTTTTNHPNDAHPVRLSTRRGSMAAPDPWSLNQPPPSSLSSLDPTGNPPSESVSRITIVRVPESAVDTNDNRAAFGYSTSNTANGTGVGSSFIPPTNRPGRSNSWGSNHSASSNASYASSNGSRRNESPGSGRRGRMSFAFSSFTPIIPPPESPTHERSSASFNYNGNGGPSSRHTTNAGGYTTAPNNSNSNPSLSSSHRRRTISNPSLAPMKPNLTAQQIYDLAVSSTSPTPSGTPGASPISTYPRGSGSRSRPGTPGTPGTTAAVAPAVFTPMPEEVYLPFVDRPAEVTQLLTEPPTSRLYHLLEALFPIDMKRGQGPILSAAEREDEDPAGWTFDRLAHHLQDTTRAEMDDKLWVDKARTCIRSRSEALWERFKGALGVPADLELEHEHEWDEEGEEDNLMPPIALPLAAAAAVAPRDDLADESLALAFQLDPEATAAGSTDGRSKELASVTLVEGDGDADVDADVDVDREDFIEEKEAYLEPVFADDGNNSEEDNDHVHVRDEEEDEDEEAEISLNMMSSAYSDGGWSNRRMENIGEGEEDEQTPEADADADASGTGTGTGTSTGDATPAVNIAATGSSTGSGVPTPSASGSEIGSAPSSYFAPRRAHFDMTPMNETDNHSLTPSSSSFGGGNSNSPQREIRALQITTSRAPNVPSTASHSGVAFPQTSPGVTYSTSPFFRPSNLSSTSLNVVGSVGGGSQDGRDPSSVSPIALAPIGSSSLATVDEVSTPGSSSTSPPMNDPAHSSPSSHSHSHSQSQFQSRSHQLSASLSPLSRGGFRRPSESISDGNSALALDPQEGSSYRGFGGYGLMPANRPYHPALSERGPGNPLFPSSFADLSVGPTLVANVPKSSRSSSVSHTSHYPPSLGHSLRDNNGNSNSGRISPAGNNGSSGGGGGYSPLRRYVSLGAGAGAGANGGPSSASAHSMRRALRGSWAEVRDKYEYAVTVASASSDGGRG